MLSKYFIKVFCFVLISLAYTLKAESNYKHPISVLDKESTFPCSIEKDKIIPAGCYDYFVFSQIWAPESFFHDIKNKEDRSGIPSDKPLDQLQRKVGYKTLANQWARGDYSTPSMIPHGLWFNFYKTKIFPTKCPSSKEFEFDKFPPELQDKMRKLYPQLTYGLDQHEWDKHGVCSDWSAQTYFKRIIKLHENKLPTPQFILNNIGKSVTYHDLLTAYGGDENQVFLSCHYIKEEDKQYFSQVATSWKLADKKMIRINEMSGYGGLSGCDKEKKINIRKLGKFIDLKQLKDSLPKKPIHVGFDIDDTLLFSEPGFSYTGNKLGFHQEKKEFWELMNTLDKYSLATDIGKKLIKLHNQRKDYIYIITARPKVKKEDVRKALEEKLGVEISPKRLIFTNSCKKEICTLSHNKTKFIKKKKIDIYYGDADADMISAQKANARAIRVQRASNSGNKSGNHIGGFEEEVLFTPEN